MVSKLVYVSFFVFILYALTLALFSNQNNPEKVYYNNFFPYLADKPITEDGYLTLTVAWNIAEGKGITYNFNRPTTGIQPLSGFIFAAVAKVVISLGGNKITFIRAILLFIASLEVLLFFIISSITKKLIPDLDKKWIDLSSAVLTLLNFEILLYFTNGLETGMYLICIGISIIYSFYYFKSEKKVYQSIVLGIVFGISCLARIDFIVVIAVALLVNLFRKRLTVKQFFVIGIASGITISPWIIYIYKTTGHLIQSSASAETSWLTSGELLLRSRALALAIMQHLTPCITTGNKDTALIIIFVVTIFIVFKWLYDRKIFYRFDNDNFKIFGSWSLGILALLFAYLLYSSAYYFYIRYTAPVLLIALPLFAVLLAVKLKVLSKKTVQVGFIAVVLLFFIQAFQYLHSGKLGEQQSLRMAYIKNHFNNTAVIGCFQSGVTGYYDSNVYNLDGKMDHDVAKYISSGNLAGYIDTAGINVIMDWNEIVDWYKLNCLNDNYLKNNWVEFSNNIGDNHTVCLIRKNSLSKILIKSKL
jgi:hypothetical protein